MLRAAFETIWRGLIGSCSKPVVSRLGPNPSPAPGTSRPNRFFRGPELDHFSLRRVIDFTAMVSPGRGSDTGSIANPTMRSLYSLEALRSRR
jgi:hypothetical protein